LESRGFVHAPQNNSFQTPPNVKTADTKRLALRQRLTGFGMNGFADIVLSQFSIGASCLT